MIGDILLSVIPNLRPRHKQKTLAYKALRHMNTKRALSVGEVTG